MQLQRCYLPNMNRKIRGSKAERKLYVIYYTILAMNCTMYSILLKLYNMMQSGAQPGFC